MLNGMKIKTFILFALLTSFTAFSSVTLFSCRTAPPKTDGEIADQIRKNPAKQLSTYSADFTSPLEDRVYEAPKALIDYLDRMDGTDRYKPYALTAEDAALFADYLAKLPSTYRALMNDKLIGFYFIDHFIGAGLSDLVLSDDGSAYCIMVLNSEILHTSIQDWISMRDSSCFEDKSGIRITNDMGNTYRELIHTLVHESAHVYDYCRNATPYTEPHMKMLGFALSSDETPFTSGVWKTWNQTIQTYDFQNRNRITSYGLGKKLDGKTAEALYQSLAKTPFVSLYGSTCWAEDYAETVAWFYLDDTLGIDYKPAVFKGALELARYEPLQNPLSRARYNALPEMHK